MKEIPSRHGWTCGETHLLLRGYRFLSRGNAPSGQYIPLAARPQRSELVLTADSNAKPRLTARIIFHNRDQFRAQWSCPCATGCHGFVPTRKGHSAPKSAAQLKTETRANASIVISEPLRSLTTSIQCGPGFANSCSNSFWKGTTARASPHALIVVIPG